MGCGGLVLVGLAGIVVVGRRSGSVRCIEGVGCCWILDIAILAGCIVEFVDVVGLPGLVDYIVVVVVAAEAATTHAAAEIDSGEY